MSRHRYEYAVLIVLLLLGMAVLLGFTLTHDEKRVCVSSATYSPSEGEWQSGISCSG
jgi:hypothetical protein